MKLRRGLVQEFVGWAIQNASSATIGVLVLSLSVFQACAGPARERRIETTESVDRQESEESIEIDIPERPAEYWQSVIARHKSIFRIGDIALNPELLAPESYVIWLNEEVAIARLALEGKRRRVPDEERREALQTIKTIREQGPIFECYMTSRFVDPGMAYDMVRFRNADITLVDQDGVAHFPARIDHGQLRTLREEGVIQFSSVNAVRFPKYDFVTNLPLLEMSGDRLRLVFTAYGTQYYCQWSLRD